MGLDSFVDYLPNVTAEVAEFKTEMARSGIDVVQISHGEKDPHLDELLRQSVLGTRTSQYSNVYNLSPYEQELVKKEPPAKILLVVDLDGVVVSPGHLQTHAGLLNLLHLARMAKASDKVVIYTGRFLPEKGPLAYSGYFPHLGKKVSDRIIKALSGHNSDEDKVTIVHKPVNADPHQLLDMMNGDIDGSPIDQLIYAGSSESDREIVRKLSKLSEFINRKRFKYFDTGHRWL